MQISRSEDSLIIIPFGGLVLGLTAEEFEKAVQRGQAFATQYNGAAGVNHKPEQILDAKGTSNLTGIPASWFLEAARQARIPYIQAGKYIRFRYSEVVKALEVRRR